MFEVFSDEYGYLMTLATLRFVLDHISSPDARWWIQATELDHSNPRLCIAQTDDGSGAHLVILSKRRSGA
jgi:hypothetical protein